MRCHICQAEAVARCYTCGQLMCAAHGDDNCTRCTTGIVAGDPRPDRITAVPGRHSAAGGWWRPQPAEEFVPPACYACHGLTRASCVNCGSYYCAEHAGLNGMCGSCGKGAWLGPAILGIMGIGVALLFLWGMVGGG
jgi:hypothetical protein